VSFALAATVASAIAHSGAKSGAQSGAKSGAQSGTQSAGTAKPTQEPQPPTFRTEANFVRVDVYPTRDGKPVQDLRAEDFEVLEDGALQSIQTFEHIVVRPAGPQAQRREPNSVGESQQLAANPRNRVFVLFLDVPHVSITSTWNVREPLIRLIDRVLGPDDLIGIMTPRMSAKDIVLARKTDVIAGGLRERWPWGERGTIRKDEEDQQLEYCYPRMPQDMRYSNSSIAAGLEARRRERLTLDALREAVLYLRDVREERKAIITVTEGWLLYRPNQKLTEVRTDASTGRQEPIPGPEPISVGPDGRITTKSKYTSTPVSKTDCDAQRMALSMIDDEQYLREIIGEANRGNASFYTIDPRGLVAFDTAMGPEPPPPIAIDAAMLRNRLESIRTLADATDGIAVMNSNDLDAGLKRISDDLSSYYLLGYYSTNGRPDGKFHNIKVRVKQSGVGVRARKGYRSPTAAEITAARTAAAAPVPEAQAMVTSAMSALSRIRPDSRFNLNAVPVRDAGSRAVGAVWIAGELSSMPGTDPWMVRGGSVDITVSGGGTSATARVTLAAGERAFSVPLTLAAAVDSGSLEIRATLSGSDPEAERMTGTLSLDLAQGTVQPLLFRRGPATGNRPVPAATFQFSRTERVRLEFPVGADARPASGRLLDRTNQPLGIPVAVAERTDAPSGQRWLTADVTLAALAFGDYAVELTIASGAGEQRVLTAIRVGR
jgi:VWFA-related protein